jgi:hypothetical protein
MLDPSTVGSVEAHHQPDHSGNDDQTNNEKQSGGHDV